MSQIIQPDAQRGFVTLDSCIRSALMDINESMSRYEQFRHWSLEAYRDFRFDVANEVSVTELSLTAWKAAELPLDYLDFAMIGVRIRGEVRVFTNNEALALYFDDVNEDGDPDIQPAGSDDDPIDINGLACTDQRYYFCNTNSYGEDTGQLYGLAVKNNGLGYFKINKQRREIQFNPTIPANTKIYLEYITDGYDPNVKTVVNVYAAKLIKLYIHWQRHTYAKSSTMAEKEMARRDYYAEYSKVQSRLCPITVGDVLDAARDAYRLTPYY